MGRGKGKVKRSSAIAHRDDASGEEEKLPVKRRGRPTKAHKEEEEEDEEISQNDDIKHEDLSENRNKRKKPSSQTNESLETMKDENGMGPKTNGNELTKPLGFRHNGSRRKNKPRRAAEVGVSLCQVCSWVVLRS